MHILLNASSIGNVSDERNGKLKHWWLHKPRFLDSYRYDFNSITLFSKGSYLPFEVFSQFLWISYHKNFSFSQNCFAESWKFYMVRLNYFASKQFGKIKGWFTKILFYNLKFSFGVLCCDFAQTYRVNKYTLGYTQLMHTLSYLVPVSKHVSWSKKL